MPKAYIADNSKFRTAVLKEYCRNQKVEALCMQDAARLLEELRSAQPDVVFLRDALLQQRPGLIKELRTEAPLDKAVVVVVASEGSRQQDTAGAGVDFWLPSSSALTQLEAVFSRIRKNAPKALVVSSYVRRDSQFCQALLDHGFEVLLAATGDRGLQEAQAHAPEIILVEGKLVDMPGADFCGRARGLEQLRTTAIFVLLARPDGATELACRKASAQDIFSPPFHAPPNIEKLRKAAGLSSAPAASEPSASHTPPAAAPPLTLASSQGGEGVARGAGPEAADRPIRVLLVDDQPIIAEAVRRVLAPYEDISFHYCKDPTQALKMAGEIGPTVILLDLVMPQLDGLALAKEFRADQGTKDIPLVILSTMEKPSVKAEAFARGANDYLIKLPDRVELLARIRYHSRAYLNLLQRNEAHRALSESQKALADAGDVANVYFQVPELRGFEQFCVGRLAEDMPTLTSRICGVCPEAHLMAAAKAVDQLFRAPPPPAARKVRELLYSCFFVADHATHFYALGGPDFIVGPDAPPAQRNILGVIHKVGVDIGRQVLQARARNHGVIKMLGGREAHPTGALPGGWSKSVSEPERLEIEGVARANVEFAQFSLKLFGDLVLKNSAYRDLVLSDLYLHKTYYMGTVDARNRANFYDGQIRVVSPDGVELLKYPPADYAQHIAERVEPWTYLKFPYLKQIGWKGFTDGPDSGVYCATPLSRLNVSDSLATPLAQCEFEKFYQTFGCKKRSMLGRYEPVHHRLATHWARLIELLYAAERMLELSRDPEITSPDVRTMPSGAINPAGGVGSVEAPRGTLTHHYCADARGVVTKVNLVVGTTNNYAPMAMSLQRAAERLIHKGVVVTEGLLNRIEMAFRLYDPCLSCATHAVGQMPLVVTVRDPQGWEIQSLSRSSG